MPKEATSVTFLDLFAWSGLLVQSVLLLAVLAMLWDVLRTILSKSRGEVLSAPTFWTDHSILMLCISAPLRFFSALFRAGAGVVWGVGSWETFLKNFSWACFGPSLLLQLALAGVFLRVVLTKLQFKAVG